MEKLKKNKLLIIPIILLVLIIILGVTYAWLIQVVNSTKVNRIKATSGLNLVLDDRTSNGIELIYAIPQSNEQGLENEAYTFKVINNGNINARYKLYLEDEEIEGEKLSNDKIKYSLVRNNNDENPRLLSTTIINDRREIEDTVINGGKTNNYTLRLWIDSEASQSEIANKVFKTRIKLEAEQTENSSSDKYSISGVVKKDDNPVTGGTVIVYPTGKTAPVNPDGSFNMDDLDNDDYDIYYTDLSEDEVQNKTQEELDNIPNIAIGKTTTTTKQVVDMTNSYTIINYYSKPIKIFRYKNPHIKSIYEYNENGTGTGTAYTGCLGGEETGCANGARRVTSGVSEFPVGTVLKYEVKPGVEKYFNVLYDKGDTLIMQQRNNEVYNVAWYDGSRTSTEGPTTILPALEAVTADWQYVNNQTYTANKTEFGTGSFKTSNTACTWTTPHTSVDKALCTDNTYAAFTRTNVKARMITANEAGQMGCRVNPSPKSCKRFMHNYLWNSTLYGGSIVDDYHTATDHNYGYWTMSSDLTDPALALFVRLNGHLDKQNPMNLFIGARAVVVINK